LAYEIGIAVRNQITPAEGNPMNLIATSLTALVAALHSYFRVLEMFLWDRPTGRRIFGTRAEFATASRTLAANQGLYNGFLAALYLQ
jgi:putative membrane protein